MILARMRDLENKIYDMKKIPGYKGDAIVDYYKDPNKKVEVPETKPTPVQETARPQLPPVPQATPRPNVPGMYYPAGREAPVDDMGMPDYSFNIDPKKAASDAWSNIIDDALAPPPLPTPKNITKRHIHPLMMDSDTQEYETQQQANERIIPNILTQREANKQKLKEIEEHTANFYNSNPNEESKIQFEEQRKQAQRTIQKNLDDITKNYGTSITAYSFKKYAESLKAYQVNDKEGTMTIPSQVSNKSQLRSAFLTKLHELVVHEKEHGTLAPDITDNDIFNGILGSQYIWHDIIGDQYNTFRDKYKDFFETFETKEEALDNLHNEFIKNGGYGNTKSNQPKGGGIGQEQLKGVKVPLSSIAWDWQTGEGRTRTIEDIAQGASRVTFDAIGKAEAFGLGMFGVSRDTQKLYSDKAEAIGSTIAEVVGSTFTGKWGEVLNDVWDNGFYKRPTAEETYKAAEVLSESTEQLKKADSPKRDIIQGLSEMAFGMTFGDFAVASKAATGTIGLGKAATKAMGLVKNIDEAGLMTNRVMNSIDEMAKLGKFGKAASAAEVVAGTTNGRRAIELAKLMLPEGAALNEAAHLATTLAYQHTLQHIDNLSTDDVIDGVKTGTIFSLANLGVGKFFGSVAQRLAVANNVAKQVGGKNAVPALTEKLQSYQRTANILGQMAGNVGTTNIQKAFDTGNWQKAFEFDRQSVIDLGMSMFGIKDVLHSLGTTKEKRIEHIAKYDEFVQSVAKGMSKPSDIKEVINAIVEEQELKETALTVIPKIEAPIDDFTGSRYQLTQIENPKIKALLEAHVEQEQVIERGETALATIPKYVSRDELDNLRNLDYNFHVIAFALNHSPDATKRKAIKFLGGKYITIADVEQQLADYDSQLGRLTQNLSVLKFEGKEGTPGYNVQQAIYDKALSDRNSLTQALSAEGNKRELIRQKQAEHDAIYLKLTSDKVSEIEHKLKLAETQHSLQEIGKLNKSLTKAKQEHKRAQAELQAEHEQYEKEVKSRVERWQKSKEKLVEVPLEGAILYKPKGTVLEGDNFTVTTGSKAKPYKETFTIPEPTPKEVEREFGIPIVVGKTALGTDIVEQPKEPVSEIKTWLDEGQHDYTIENLGEVLSAKAETVFERKVGEAIAKLVKGNKGKVIFQTEDIQMGTVADPDVAGKYEASKNTIRLKYGITPSEYVGFSPFGTAVHEVLHSITADAIEKDITYRGEVNKLYETVQNALGTMSPDKLEELVHRFSASKDDAMTMLGLPDFISTVLGGNVDQAKPNKHLHEFMSVAGERGKLLSDILSEIPIPPQKKGKLKTAYDWFLSLFTRKAKGTDKTALTEYLRILNSTPANKHTMSADEFASVQIRNTGLEHTAKEVFGVQLEPLDYNDENVGNLRIIKSYILAQPKPFEALAEAVTGAREATPQLTASLHAQGEQVALEQGRDYNLMSGAGKIQAVAQAIIKNQSPDIIGTSEAIRTLNSVKSIAEGYKPKPDIPDTEPKYEFMVATNSINNDMYVKTMSKWVRDGIDNFNARTSEVTERLQRTNPHLVEAWQAEIGKLWMTWHDQVEMTPLALNITDGLALTIKTDRLIMDEEGTEGAKVARKRQTPFNLDVFRNALMEDVKNMPYYKDDIVQLFAQVVKDSPILNIQQTIEQPKDKPAKSDKGLIVRSTKQLGKAMRNIFESTGYHFIPKGSDGNVLLNIKPFKDAMIGSIMQPKPVGEILKNFNQFRNAIIWRTIESTHFRGDGQPGEKYGAMSMLIDINKLHKKINTEGTSPEKVQLKDIIRTELKGTPEYENLEKMYESMYKPLLADVAAAVKRVNTTVHGKEMVPFTTTWAAKAQSNKQPDGTYRIEFINHTDDSAFRSAALKELQTMTNAFLHTMVDGGGDAYAQVTPNGEGIKLSKFGEKYMSLHTSERFHYKTANDMLRSILPKYRDVTDEDLKRIHGIHKDKDGTHYMNMAVLDTDILPKDHPLFVLNDLYGKVNTDGSTFVFDEPTFKYMAALQQAEDVGHIKIAHTSNKNGHQSMYKGEIHYIPLDKMIEASQGNEKLMSILEPLIPLARNLKEQSIAALTMATTLKGTSYNPHVTGDKATTTQRKVISIKKSDGTFDTNKEMVDAANIATQEAILTGGQVPEHALYRVDLHGAEGAQYIGTTKPNKNVASPGLDVQNLIAAVGDHQYNEATKDSFDRFFENKRIQFRESNHGYSLIQEIIGGNMRPKYADFELQRMGTFLKKLARKVESFEEGNYSLVDMNNTTSTLIRKAIDENGNAIIENLFSALLVNPDVHTDKSIDKPSYIKAMLHDLAQEALAGHDIGSIGHLQPDVAGLIHHKQLMDILDAEESARLFKHVSDVSNYDQINTAWKALFPDMQRPSNLNEVARLMAHAKNSNLYARHLSTLGEHIDMETGRLKDGGQGVIVSKDIFYNLRNEARKEGRELTFGSKVLGMVTPKDATDGVVPLVVVGVIDTPNTIIVNKELALKWQGKDNDGDQYGISIGSKAWENWDGTDGFEKVWNNLTEYGVHKGRDKKEADQEGIMNDAKKVKGEGTIANSRLTIADGSTVPSKEAHTNPLHPENYQANLNSLVDMGVVVKQQQDIAQAFQNAFANDMFQDANVRHELRLPRTKVETVGGKKVRVLMEDMVVVFDKNMVRNESIVKQLGAVDAYVAHTLDIESLLYGSYILSDGGKKFSELSTKERQEAIREFNNWVSIFSGKVVGDFTKDRSSTREQVENHLVQVPIAGSVNSKLLREMPAEMNPRKLSDNGIISDAIDHTMNTYRSQYEQFYRNAVKTLKEIPVLKAIIDNIRTEGNAGYYSGLEERYYVVRKDEQGKDVPQNPIVQRAMLSAYYYATQTADYSVAAQQQLGITTVFGRPTKISLKHEDNRGAWLEVQGVDKRWYLNQVVNQDGTLASGFAEAMANGGGDASILFNAKVKQGLKVPSLTLKESNYLLGSVLANVSKEMERMVLRKDGNPSRGSVAAEKALGYFLGVSAAALVPKYSGTLINHRIPNVEAKLNAQSNFRFILEGAEANGVVAVAPDGRKMRDVIFNAINSEARTKLPANDEYASTLISARKFTKLNEAEEVPPERRDLTKPENIEWHTKKAEAIWHKQFGETINQDKLNTLLEELAPTLAVDMQENLKRAMSKDEVAAIYANSITNTTAALERIAKAIDLKGNEDTFLGNLRMKFQTITPLRLNDKMSLVSLLADKQQVYSAETVIAPNIGFRSTTDGNIEPVMSVEKLSDHFRQETLNPLTGSIYAKDIVEHVLPHAANTAKMNMFLKHIDDLHETMTTSNTDNYDIQSLVKVLDTDQIELPNVRVSVDTDGLLHNSIKIKLDGKEFDTSSDNFIYQLKNYIAEVPLGERMYAEGAVPPPRLTRKYTRNYDEGTPLYKRRLFSTEYFRNKDGWNKISQNNEHIQGQAWVEAVEDAANMKEPIYIHDIPTDQWYRKEHNQDTPESINAMDYEGEIRKHIADDNYHITSKLEDALNDEHHHGKVKSVFDMYGKDKDTGKDIEAARTLFEETVPQVEIGRKLSSDLEANEQGIRDALLRVVIGKVQAVQTGIGIRTAIANMEFYTGNKNLPGHTEDYKNKSIADAQTLMNRLTDPDLTKIISTMAVIKDNNLVGAYDALEEIRELVRFDERAAVALGKNLYRLENHEVSNNPADANRMDLVRNARGAFERALSDLGNRLGRTKLQITSQNKQVTAKGQDYFSTSDVLGALGRHDLLTMDSDVLKDTYKGMIEKSMSMFDKVATDMYYTSPESNVIAHTNILAGLSSRNEQGKLPQVVEDIGKMMNDIQEAGARGEPYIHTNDVGKYMQIQYLDNSGEAQLGTGYYVGSLNIPEQARVVNDEGILTREFRDTGVKLPMIAIASDRGLNVIRLDNVQTIRSMQSHSINKRLEGELQRKIANSKDMERLMREVAANMSIHVETINDNTYKSIMRPDDQFGLRTARIIDKFSDENKGFKSFKSLLNRYITMGQKMSVLGSYMRVNDIGTVIGSTLAGATMGDGIAGAAFGALAGLGLGWSKSAVKALSPILDNFASIPVAAQIMNGRNMFTALYHSMVSNTGYKVLFKSFDDNVISKDLVKLTSNATERRLRNNEMGQATDELGLSAYHFGQFNEKLGIFNKQRIKLSALGKEMKKVEGTIKKDLSGSSTMIGVQNLTEYVTTKLGIDLLKKDLQAFIVDGKVKVLHQGKDIDGINALKMDLITALASTMSLHVLPMSEISGTKFGIKANSNLASAFMPEINSESPARVSNYIQAITNMSHGNYGGKNVQQKSGIARIATAYQTFGAGKALYKTTGLAERKMYIDYLKTILGKDNVSDIKLDGINQKDPDVQLRNYVLNGIGASIAKNSIKAIIGQAILGASYGTLVDELMPDSIELASRKIFSNLFGGTSNVFGDVVGSLLYGIMVAAAPDEWAKNKKGTIPKGAAEVKELIIGETISDISRQLNLGLGESAVLGTLGLTAQLGRNLVVESKYGNFAEARAIGTEKLVVNTAKSDALSSQYTSILAVPITGYAEFVQQYRKKKK